MKLLSKLFKPKPTSKTDLNSQRDPQQSNAYDRIGGEKVVAALAKQFYQQMQTRTEAQALLAMHKGPIAHSEQKLFEFLSGWLGGPPLFERKHGHPALKARHMPFAIDEQMRDQWLLCMKAAIDIEISDPQHQQAIYQAIAQLADHMRNQ
ncbi:group II truncated hemoglobin [Shewanella waksmanii]|uniref:group II truncated hemoglobin n=1 Tax=Shewanella waksmanii TaxID=213783 RepID=UPI003735007C